MAVFLIRVARAASGQSDHSGAPGDAPSITAVGDIRVDNRSSLCAELGIHRDVADTELVVHAWKRWGPAFPDRLVGDYAVALRDALSRSLYLVRDPMGCRPLYYAVGKDFVAVGSRSREVAAQEGVDRTLNLRAIAAGLTDLWGDCRFTAYRGVHSVPAGHTVRIDLGAGVVTIQRHWNPQPETIRSANDHELEERFREIFLDAVRCRLPEDGAVATDLSGGLDSSSITAACSILLKRPVLAIASSFADEAFEGGAFDEGAFRAVMRSAGAAEVLDVPASGILTAAAVDEVLLRQDLPDAGVLLPLSRSRYQAAAARGAKVLLDGFDGDTAVGFGYQRAVGLLATFRWLTLYRELTGLASHSGIRLRSVARGTLLNSVSGLAHRMLRIDQLHGQIARRDFMLEQGLDMASEANRMPLPGSPKREGLYFMTTGALARSVDGREAESIGMNLTVLHPFFDRRLVEFCLALPADQLMRDGWTRSILRRALAGILPEQVRWRSTKASLSSNFIRAYAVAVGVPDLQRTHGGAVADYLDQLELARNLEAWNSTRDLHAAFRLILVAQAARWLELR